MQVFGDVLRFLTGTPAMIGLLLTSWIIFVAADWRVALWALLPAIWKYLRARDFLYAGVSLFIALLILLAMTGLLAFDA